MGTTIKRRDGAASDDATPIGSLPRGHVCSARRVRLDDTGEVVFGSEEPLFVAVQLRSIELLGGRTVSHFRLEAKASGKPGGPLAGEQLAITEAPYGNGWSTTARFRRGLKRGRGERARSDAPDLESALRALEEAATDPWETGNYVTAGIAPPALRAPLRSYGRAAQWVFGVCEDAEAWIAVLATCERAKRLLDDTVHQRLRIVRPSTSGAPVAVRVHPRASEEAAELLMTSIRQALAGPVDDGSGRAVPLHAARAPAPRDPWLDRPVMDLVDRIYRDHLHNRTRTSERRERREVAYEE